MSKLIGIAIALTSLMTVWTSVEAQCFPQQVFATVGGGPTTDRVRVDTAGAENQGNETGRFWQSSNSTLGNNFGGGCASDAWWVLNPSPLRAVDGTIGNTGCLAGTCPGDALTLLVEDRSPAGDTAYFIALRVDETPGGIRWWDFSRVDPAPSPSVLTMEEYPRPQVTGSTAIGPNEIGLDLLYPDVAGGVHAVEGTADEPLPASRIVRSLDLYRYVGNADPGRETDSWVLLDRQAYEDGPSGASVVVSCPVTDESVYLALGLSFHGGDGPDVAGALVGSPVAIDCYPWFPPLAAGTVPDGAGVAGKPLTLAKSLSPEEGVVLTLNWDPSCVADDHDYAIYRGRIGEFADHEPLFCSTAGERTATFQPSAESVYYLVVPRNGWLDPPTNPPREGSYGLASDGTVRPQSPSPCWPQWTAPCP